MASLRTTSLAFATILAASIASLSAQTSTVWQGTDASGWDDIANWSAGLPEIYSEGATGVAQITGGNVVEFIDRIGDISVTSLQVLDGTLNLSNSVLNMRAAYVVDLNEEGWPKAREMPTVYPYLYVGLTPGTVSYLNVSNGAQITGIVDPSGTAYEEAPQLYLPLSSQAIYLGGAAGATGHMTVADAGTVIDAGVLAGVGYLERIPGTSQFTAHFGGVGSVAVSDGAVLKRGIKAAYLQGEATVTIESGARVEGGVNVGSQGGRGTVLIHDGASVQGGLSAGYDTVAPNAGLTQNGEGRITVSGSNVLVNEAMPGNPNRLSGGGLGIQLGSGRDRGYLSIEDGAKVYMSSMYMGDNLAATNIEGGEGELRVSGDGSELVFLPTYMLVNNRDYLYGANVNVGYSDVGRVIVEDGALLRVVSIDAEEMALSTTITQSTFTLGGVKGAADPFWGTPLRDGKGVLQIGDGGRAGVVLIDEIRTGQGTGEVLFKHTESAYTLASRITTKTSVTAESGRSILTGNNTYTGLTSIKEGATLVGGHRNALGVGIVEVYGTLEVDKSISTLELSDYVEMNGGGALAFTVTGDSDAAPAILVNGDMEFFTDNENFNFEITLGDDFDAASDYEWTLITVTGDIYYFDETQINLNLAGWTVYQDNQSIVLSYQAIPEPSSVVLLSSALAGAWLLRRRSQKAVEARFSESHSEIS